MAEDNPYLNIVRQDAVQSAVNPYSQFVDAGDGAAGTPGRLSMMQVADRNPDLEARLQALAKQYAVPVDSVRLQEPEYQRRATVDSIDYQTLAKDYPTTAGMIYDTQKAAISYDDTPNLSAIEKGVRFLTNSGRALVSAIPQFNASAWGVAQAGADALATITSPLAGTILPENPFERVSRGIAELRQRQDQTTKDVMPKGTGVVDSGWYSGLQSLGQMGLALPAAATGQPQAALGILSSITGGQAYGEARDKGLPFQQALPFAASQAAIEYATEKIPVARFLTDFKAGTPFYSMLARNMAAEVPGEQVATLLQDLNEWAVLNPEKPFSTYLEERPSAAAQTLIATLVASGGAVSTAKGVELAADRLRGRNSVVQQGMEDGATLAQLSEAAAASKLRARDPETFREFVAQAAEDGPVQDVYIDVSQLQALAQSGVDLSALAAASPSAAEQLPVAAATGGMVRIPIDEYATTVAGTEIGDALLPHLKTDPAGMTRAEAETFMQDQATHLQQEVERTLAEQAPQDQFNTSRAVVEQQMLEQLNQVNRFTEDVNRSYAAMMANFYGVQALRLGITPEEMAARYPVKLQAESIERPGTVLNQEMIDQAKAGIEQLVASVDQPGNKSDKVSIAPAQDWLVRAAQDAGLEIGGFRHAVDSSAIRHVRKNHGNEAKEKARGQLPVTDADFAMIPDLIASPDKIVFGTQNRLGRDQIGYLKTLPDGSTLYLEEVRTGRKELAAQSMRRYPATMNVENIVSTLDPNAQSDGGNALIVVDGPGTGNTLSQNQRGSITLSSDMQQQPTIITLLQNADLSTFLHESGHFYLEVLTDIARRPDAPQEIKDDVQALLDWFGVPDLATWDGYDLEQKRTHHEQLARGFEAYLFEGKAPSVELQGVFARFRAWMINVYRSLQALNVSLTDEVRSVLDRMVASSDAIAEMQAVRGMAPLFESAEAAGMSPDEWQAYQNLGAEAQQDATAQLEARSLRDMRWLSNARSRTIKAMQKDAETKRASVREEVAGEVYATPLYGSMQFLKRGTTTAGGEAADMSDVPHKLSIEALTNMYGGEGDKFALLDWSQLGYGQYGMLAREGLHPDVVAQMFGYTSGDQLVHALLEAEPVDQVIDRMTDQRMLERFGDLSDPAAIQRAADLAVHNEGRAKFVATELNALNRATGQRQVLARAARQFAEAAIARLRVRDIKPSQYAVAEAKAARAAQEALRKDDLVAAAVQKRNQLVNNYATRAAYAAREEVDKSVEYLTKFDREGVRKNVDPAYLDQIDGLLERFDLRKGTTLRDLEKRKSLLDWVQSQEEQGLQPVIDPALIDEANRKSYKDMTLEELRGLTDAVKNIEHLGRLKKKLLTAKDQREFQAVADEIAASIQDNAKGIVAERRISDRGPLVDVASLFRNFLADHRKFASVAREFDGWKDGGPTWEYLVRNMNEAGDFEAVENERATLKLQELFAPVLAGGKLTAKTYFPALDKSFTREERIGMALNMGNEVNRERVLSGERLSPGQLRGVLDTLTKEDWDFVQGVWDYLESFRPQIAAKEKRLTGIEPAWVEPTPVQTKYGEYKGGYYPIKYDPLRSTRAEADTNAEVQRQIERGMYTRAMTRRGHLKERSESTGRPIRYDMNVVFEHVQQVVHDLAWHEYLVDANRLLRAGVVDSAIRTHYGPEINRTLRDTLRDVAIGNMGALDSLDKLMNHLRTGSTIVGLGWRVTTSLLQPLGLTQTAARIGTKWMLKGIKHWAGDSLRLENSAKQIYGMSDFMRLRAKTMQREINEIRNKVQGKDSRLQASYFYLIQKAQLIADIPTWWGAYEKAMAENGMTEERAIALADQAVLDSQGGGQVKDLAAIQRGGAGKKLFTSFYSFFNTTYNLTSEVVGRTDFRKPRDVAMLVCDLLLLYTIPAAVSTLIKAALHGDDDQEKLMRNLIADQLNYLFGTMVLLREAGAAVQATAGAGGVDYTGPAAVRFFAELAKLGKQVQQGEPDEAFWKALNSVAGIVFHYPAGQINSTISGINALADGKTENPGALLVGAPPKK